MSVLYPNLSFTTFPNSIQMFTTFLDITAADAALIQQYQTAMQAGNIQEAQGIFAQIQNGNQKIIDAIKLNTLMDTALALENFFKTDVEPYIDTKQAEWQSIINLFTYQGVFSPVTTYQKNNFVLYTVDGVQYVFIAISNPPVGTPPTNTIYWRNISVRGEKGDSGVGLSFLYEWNSATNYLENNVVTYANFVWGALQENQNQAPFEGSDYWAVIGSIRPREIPITSQTPVSQETGDLWFQIIE